MLVRVIDFETTPSPENPEDERIIEAGWQDVAVYPGISMRAPHLLGEPRASLFNPGCPIAPGSMAVHHILDETVAAFPRYIPTSIDWLAPHEGQGEGPVAFVAHSADHDWKFVQHEGEPIPWICTYKCALRLIEDAPDYKNGTLRYYLRWPNWQRNRRAHRAGVDAWVTANTFMALLELATMEDMIEWSQQPALTRRCYIGDYRNEGKGTKWDDVPTSMLTWILSKDFKEDIKFTAEHHLHKREEADRAGWADQRSE